MHEALLFFLCSLFLLGILCTMQFIFAIPVPVLLMLAGAALIYCAHTIIQVKLQKDQ